MGSIVIPCWDVCRREGMRFDDWNEKEKNHDFFLVSSENSMILMNLGKERIKLWVIDNRDNCVHNYIWNRSITWK